MATTKYTDLNLITSGATFLANNLTGAGWEVYWQLTDVLSGTATQGSVTLVPEFPNEPSLLVAPPRTRVINEVLMPAFAVTLSSEPVESFRAGLGDTEFEQRGSLLIEGFVVDTSQHLAFATLLREWFREDASLPLYDYELSPENPSIVTDSDVVFRNRRIDRLEFVEKDVPVQARYYINMEVDIVFYD